jgi:hypothetical protein
LEVADSSGRITAHVAALALSEGGVDAAVPAQLERSEYEVAVGVRGVRDMRLVASMAWIYRRKRAKKSKVRAHASSAATSLYIDGASQLLNACPAA